MSSLQTVVTDVDTGKSLRKDHRWAPKIESSP